jgi:hypothetical protein
MGKDIGTAPEHNPNQEYPDNVEVQVFCQDEQKMIDKTLCRKIGDEWYSRKFIASLDNALQVTAYELSTLMDFTEEWLQNGDLDVDAIALTVSYVESGTKVIKKCFEKIGVDSNGKAVKK